MVESKEIILYFVKVQEMGYMGKYAMVKKIKR